MNAERGVALCRVDDLQPDTGRAFDVAGHPIALFRTRRDGMLAVGATCPHGLGPLADGIVTGHSVACPLHNWNIDLRTGVAEQDACADIRTYDVAVRDGVVYVQLPLAEPSAEAAPC